MTVGDTVGIHMAHKGKYDNKHEFDNLQRTVMRPITSLIQKTSE